jgi:hypothetical protein
MSSRSKSCIDGQRMSFLPTTSVPPMLRMTGEAKPKKGGEMKRTVSSLLLCDDFIIRRQSVL